VKTCSRPEQIESSFKRYNIGNSAANRPESSRQTAQTAKAGLPKGAGSRAFGNSRQTKKPRITNALQRKTGTAGHAQTAKTEAAQARGRGYPGGRAGGPGRPPRPARGTKTGGNRNDAACKPLPCPTQTCHRQGLPAQNVCPGHAAARTGPEQGLPPKSPASVTENRPLPRWPL